MLLCPLPTDGVREQVVIPAHPPGPLTAATALVLKYFRKILNPTMSDLCKRTERTNKKRGMAKREKIKNN